MKSTRFVGLDVHADSIAVAVAEPTGEVRTVGTIPNDPEAVRKLVKKLGPPQAWRACYDAGPCGYALYWQLTSVDAIKARLTERAFSAPPALRRSSPGTASAKGLDLTAYVNRMLEGVRTWFGLPDAASHLLEADRETLNMGRYEYILHVLFQRSLELREKGPGFDAPGAEKKKR
jgi:hypothetical protein